MRGAIIRILTLVTLGPLSLTLAACQEQCKGDQPGCNELANKHEYSLLQAMAYRLEDRQHDRRYLVFPKALDSDLTVVAFPRADASVGYVTLLTNSQVSPRDKALPDEDFVVTQEDLDDVKAEAALSAEVERHIRDMVMRRIP